MICVTCCTSFPDSQVLCDGCKSTGLREKVKRLDLENASLRAVNSKHRAESDAWARERDDLRQSVKNAIAGLVDSPGMREARHIIVEREREACAKLVEQLGDEEGFLGDKFTAIGIAAAIRSRGGA